MYAWRSVASGWRETKSVNGPSPAVTTALIGSICETVVSGPVVGPTRSPTWLFANPARPSIGAVTFVYPRFNSLVAPLLHPLRRLLYSTQRLRWQYLAPAH